MSITTAAVLSSGSKAGRTVSLVLDAYNGGTSTFVYDSTATVTNGYVARIDPDGTYTPLAGGVVTATASNPNFNGNSTFSGTVGITPSTNLQTALTINAPSAGTVDAAQIYVGATKKIWVDNAGVLNAATASISALTITQSISLPGPITVVQGGTGTTSPGLLNGNQIAITGPWPNQTIAVASSPSFTSMTLGGQITFPADGTANSTTTNYGSNGGLTWGYSSWDSTNGTVAHTWQLTVPDGAQGNLRFLEDSNFRFVLQSGGGVLFKGVTGNATVASVDKNGLFTSRGLTLQDSTDQTKQASFVMSTIATGTTQTFTFPNVSGTFITTGDTGTVTNTMLAGSIAQTKLAGFAGVNVGGALTGATSGAFSQGVTIGGSLALNAGSGISIGGKTTLLNDGTWVTIKSPSASGGFLFQNAAGSANNVSFTDAGAISALSFSTGSSSFAATSATVNGTLQVNTTASIGGANGTSSLLYLIKTLPTSISAAAAYTYMKGSNNGYGLGMGVLSSNHCWIETFVNDAVGALQLDIVPGGKGNVTMGGALILGSGYTGISPGDIAVARNSATTTGAIFFGNAGTRYLYYDGTNYNMPGANLVLNGTTVTSSRETKTGIRALDVDSLDIIRNTTIVRFRYKDDPADYYERTGFIAEDTPEVITGYQGKGMDQSACIAVLMDAVKKLTARLEALEAA